MKAKSPTVHEKLDDITPKLIELFPHRFLSQVKTIYDAFWLLFHFRTHILKSRDLAGSAEEYYFYFTYERPDAVDTLKENLDTESTNIIDGFVKKWKGILQNSLLNYDFVHSDNMNQTNKLRNSLNISRKKYPTISIVPEIFYYHSGLVYLPKAVLIRIKHSDVIDCGAFTGDSSLVFEKNYSFGKIHAFEPNANNYMKLLDTIRRYQLRTVIPIQKAVGYSPAKGVTIHNGSGSTIEISRKNLPNDEGIEICSIDSFLTHTKGRIGVIKMDIEGFEREALKGAVKTIRKYKPVLLISIYHSTQDFFEIKPFLESLHLGYRFKIRKLNPYKSLYEVMLIAY